MDTGLYGGRDFSAVISKNKIDRKFIGIFNEKSGNFTSKKLVKLSKIFGYDQ